MKLEEILEKQTEPEFEDEKINSNFYLISLPVSLRKLKSMEGSKDYEERLRENEWLKDICPKCTETGAISLDRLKMERFFGIPAKDPKWEKQNGRKLLGFTMLSKEDLCQVIEEVGFFEHWNWGNYRTYFQ